MSRDLETLFLKIKEFIPDTRIFTNEKMSQHTTFKIGGAADLFVEIANVAELQKVLVSLKETGLTSLNKD